MRRIDQRARLLDVLAQHLAQRGMQQVRAGVVAHGGETSFLINYRIYIVSRYKDMLGEDAMCTHSLYRKIATEHFCEDRLVIRPQQPSLIADLPARFCIERRVIENDVGHFTSFCALYTPPILYHKQD